MGNMLVSIEALNEKGRCFTLIAFQLDTFSFSAKLRTHVTVFPLPRVSVSRAI